MDFDTPRLVITRDNARYSISCKRDLEAMRLALGPEPMRFAPSRPEKSTDHQLAQLPAKELKMFDMIVERLEWENCFFADKVVLRYCRNCRSSPSHPFHFEKTLNAMKMLKKERDTNVRRLTLTCQDVCEQLETGTIFPLPDLRTIGGLEVFYMKPSRYVPRRMKLDDLIDNLAYVMNCMLEKERNCKRGVSFLANMDNWQFGKNFETHYCFEFMQMLRGNRIPVRVELFLIVNPKPWFDKVWKLMKPMLSEEFARKVHMIPEKQLGDFLKKGYQENIPDEMKCGRAPTKDLVSDFMSYRFLLEGCEKTGPMMKRKDCKIKHKIYNPLRLAFGAKSA